MLAYKIKNKKVLFINIFACMFVRFFFFWYTQEIFSIFLKNYLCNYSLCTYVHTYILPLLYIYIHTYIVHIVLSLKPTFYSHPDPGWLYIVFFYYTNFILFSYILFYFSLQGRKVLFTLELLKVNRNRKQLLLLLPRKT